LPESGAGNAIPAKSEVRSGANHARNARKHEQLATGIAHGDENLGDGPPILAGNREVYANGKAARKKAAKNNPSAVYTPGQTAGKMLAIAEQIRDWKSARN
jgi:hypothetical protein